MNKTIKSGAAMLNVLESWGVDHVYGIPGGSFDTIMNAFYEKQEDIEAFKKRYDVTDMPLLKEIMK